MYPKHDRTKPTGALDKGLAHSMRACASTKVLSMSDTPRLNEGGLEKGEPFPPKTAPRNEYQLADATDRSANACPAFIPPCLEGQGPPERTEVRK